MIRTARRLLVVVVILLAELAGVQAPAQARDTIAIMRTRYNTFKTQAKAQGDLKAKFDKLDQDIARAAQLGRTGELRRLYTQGMALAQNRPWNPDVEFAASLALQTDHVFVDPAAPVAFKLAQIFLPSIELAEPLSMRVTLNRPATGGAAAQGGEKLKDVGLFTNVGRDLIDSPFKFNVDFSQAWAGLATFAGGVTPQTAPQVKTIAQFVVHGDADTTAPVERSRTMVAELKRLGVDHEYVEVKGGSHGSVVAPNLAAMFEFFDRHKK